MLRLFGFFVLFVCIVLAAGCSQDPAPAVPDVKTTANDQQTVTAVCRITAELLGVKVSEVQPSTSLGDLSADDLDAVELVMELEEHFDVSIPDAALTGTTASDSWQYTELTMSDLAAIVNKQLQ